MGDHAVFLEGPGILEVAAHAVHHLLPHGYDLLGQRESEIALHKLRDQRIACLVALLGGRALIETCGPVRGVDLATHPDRHGHLAAHEPEALVLQREEPVGVHHRVEQPLDCRDERGVDQPAAEYLSREVLGRAFQVVEVESDVLGHVGVSSREVDLRHAQSDRGAALLLCRPLLVGRRLHGGVVREGHCDRLFERQGLSRLLCREGERRGHRCRQAGDPENVFHSDHCVCGTNIWDLSGTLRRIGTLGHY